MLEQKLMCEKCGNETVHTFVTRVERWQDPNIPDCELTDSEISARINGDYIVIVTCTGCGHKEAQL